MALPTWQEKVVEPVSAAPIATVPFSQAKKFFAVDASGSTAGGIMRSQERTVRALHDNLGDQAVMWHNRCGQPRYVEGADSSFFDGFGGTSPACILEQPAAVDQIKTSDLWLLLTDGQIGEREVTRLTQQADALNVIQVPIVLVITGGRSYGPEHADISVGVSFFACAREALILFKDYTSGQIFVIDAKGGFEKLKSKNSDGLSGWDSLPKFGNEGDFNQRCQELDIRLLPGEERHSTRAVSLGAEWDSRTDNVLVNVGTLLEQKRIALEDLRNLLEEEAIKQLALLCKTRGQLDTLRDLIRRHKQEEIAVRLEDRHGAGEIMQKMQDPDAHREKLALMDQLRKAHTANREAYLESLNHPSEESKKISEINRLIDRGLQIIAGLEKSSYTADILDRKSNRAMRSNVVSASDATVHLAKLDLSDDVYAFRGTCSICCGEEQIMSVVLKRLDTVEENTTDFALNFPLAAAQAKQNANMISSQCICFQCALLCPRSIHREDIVATVPTVDYQGDSKRYINHQLTLAITAGLATGASGILQIFMAILDRTLQTKDWCSKDHLDDFEVRSRREIFEWTLQNLLERCPCRENFTETGDWVKYPKALTWAFKEFETAKLDSWIIQYPLAGFNQLLRWSQILDLGVAPEAIAAVHRAKLIHQVVTVMMNGLLREQPYTRDKSWTYPFLHLVYREFNAPGIPRDMGASSILPAESFWQSQKLTDALGQWEDVKRFLSFFDSLDDQSERQTMASRIQLVIFWALYLQKGHTTPKTFFATVKSREPLAPAALDPTAILPDAAVKDVLLSIFCPDFTQRLAKNAHLGAIIPPFATPFGASVLKCGLPGCNTPFYSAADAEKGPEAVANGIRARRAKHLNEVYGIDEAHCTQTGLPDPTKAPQAPASYNNTLHISTARVWDRLGRTRRRGIIAAVGEAEAGARVDVKRDQAIIAADGDAQAGANLDDQAITSTNVNPSATANLDTKLNQSDTVANGSAPTAPTLNTNPNQTTTSPKTNTSSSAVDAFITEVKEEICIHSGRGNIYSASIEEEIRAILPSFLRVLREASRREGLGDMSGAEYEFDWKRNTIEWKVGWELGG